MPEIIIIDNESRRTIKTPFTSTKFETDKHGNRFYTLVFDKVALKFNQQEFFEFTKDVNAFSSECVLNDFLYAEDY
jgi:hypothetical protein